MVCIYFGAENKAKAKKNKKTLKLSQWIGFIDKSPCNRIALNYHNTQNFNTFWLFCW